MPGSTSFSLRRRPSAIESHSQGYFDAAAAVLFLCSAGDKNSAKEHAVFTEPSFLLLLEAAAAAAAAGVKESVGQDLVGLVPVGEIMMKEAAVGWEKPPIEEFPSPIGETRPPLPTKIASLRYDRQSKAAHTTPLEMPTSLYTY